MASDTVTGTLLKTLAASKPGGKFLELGTDTGLAALEIIKKGRKNDPEIYYCTVLLIPSSPTAPWWLSCISLSFTRLPSLIANSPGK